MGIVSTGGKIAVKNIFCFGEIMSKNKTSSSSTGTSLLNTYRTIGAPAPNAISRCNGILDLLVAYGTFWWIFMVIIREDADGWEG
jgi:hypothetical protein